MRIALTAAVSALALGAAACTPSEQDNAQADVNEAAAETGDAAQDAGAVIKEEAAQVGSAIAAGAREAGQEIDEATDKLAEKADDQQAETAADEKGN